MVNKNREGIDTLKEIAASTLNKIINENFYLLDIPNHRNIGDSLIWKGELEYFKTSKFKLIKQFNRDTFRKSEIKNSNFNILLHGGGNFGDIYPVSQEFKLNIVKSFPENRIIIMPQTVHYQDKDNIAKDFKVFNKHSNLFILVRDRNSYQLLEDYFDKDRLFLVPDMAFFLNLDSDIKNFKTGKTLLLNRTDAESVSLSNIIKLDSGSYDILDWPTYDSSSRFKNTINNYIEALDGKISKIVKYIPILNKSLDDAYGFKKRNGMDSHIQKGIEFINNYDTVYTTRLHGMILSILLGKQVFILDNSYGKNRSYYEAWLTKFENLTII